MRTPAPKGRISEGYVKSIDAKQIVIEGDFNGSDLIAFLPGHKVYVITETVLTDDELKPLATDAGLIL